MPDLVRQEIAATADTVVVKVGTRVLTNDQGILDESRIVSLASELAELVERHRRMVVVSSGAVGAGIGRLNLHERPSDLAQLQAVAAVGQSRLTEAYDRALRPHGLHAAQVLLTADDLDDRTRYLNVRNTLLALFRFGAVPIINENDTVAVDELQISFGDNDRLAALVTNLLQAPLLVLLSDVDGLYDGPPDAPNSQIVSTVTNLDAATRWVQAGGRRKPTDDSSTPPIRLSRGGMASKLAAARIATTAGENVIIASGRQTGTLRRIMAGEVIGTLILAEGPAIAARKRWLSRAARPRGQIWLDEGAVRAVQEQGRSLLAVGITSVQGDFHKGDVVALCDANGREFARGLTNYSHDAVLRIAGHPTTEIAGILGHRPYDEVIHRDNLARMIH
ncbi:MAG: glutamate 5-kinase [Pirellulales bacterium]|nr:glutamate 5-kinase [Pirellulales bacterium]